ncbi:MAG: signal peptidase I [Pseudomonadota bacterium]
MYTDLSSILAIATLATAAVYFLDRLFFRAKRVGQAPFFVRIATEALPVLFIVLVLRVCIGEFFWIPSGSMKPTLLEGDFVLVNKFVYGIRLPIVGTTVWKRGTPQRGDIMVFHHPTDIRKEMIKRVIGLPGDVVSYKDKVLHINGVAQNIELVAQDLDVHPSGRVTRVQRAHESLGDVQHDVFFQSRDGEDMLELTVPAGQYFLMGDNRDNSRDSREWGLVDDRYIIGKAVYIMMSWDPVHSDVRWHRIGEKLQ